MELQVRTFDKYSGSNLVTKSKTTGRGDVIVVQGDGSYWGPNQLKNPAYLIIRVPVSRIEAEAMLSREVGDSLVNPRLYLRQFKLDLDILVGLGYQIPNATAMMAARYPNGQDTDGYLGLPANPILSVRSVDFRAAKVQKVAL